MAMKIMKALIEARRHVVIDVETGHVFDVTPDPRFSGESHFECVGKVSAKEIAKLVESAKRGKQ